MSIVSFRPMPCADIAALPQEGTVSQGRQWIVPAGGAQLNGIDNDHRPLVPRQVVQKREASDTGKLDPGARRELHCPETGVHLVSDGIVRDEFVSDTDDEGGGAPLIGY